MIRSNTLTLVLLFLLSCQSTVKQEINEGTLASLGSKFKIEFTASAKTYEGLIEKDSTNVDAYLGLAESNIILYVFGYIPRNKTIPVAQIAYDKANKLDSLNSNVQKLSAILSFLNWDWKNTEEKFKSSIKADPNNLNARHWYSLYLSAMGNFDKAMAQSDTIMTMDPEGNYLIGRGSLLYFARRFADMKSLMIETVARDTTVAWGYDWLGMAYIELKEYEKSVETYYKAFELSDGTVEVGAGLGHALGQAGMIVQAKQIADFYSLAAKDNYLPPVQRSFIHIGLGEYDEALSLLEQAYKEQSWFLIFMQIEPWYDPIRNDQRFADIMKRMKFPK